MKRLEDEQSRLRTIFDEVLHYIGLLDAQGCVIEVNQHTLEMTGTTRDQIVGQRLWESGIWRRSQGPQERFEEAVAKAAAGALVKFEADFELRDGRTRCLDITLQPVEDENGAVLGLIVEGHDVTERKAMVEHLRELESTYRTIFETTGTGTFIYGGDGVISLVNEEFARLTGYDRSEVEGRMRAYDFIEPESLAQVLDYHDLRAEDPHSVPRSYEVRARHKSGAVHDGIVTVAIVPGTELRVVSYLDITEKKKAEAHVFRSQKMAALGQLMAGVAHEINNPNNFISLNIPIIRQYLDALRPTVEREAAPDEGVTVLGMSCAEIFEDLHKLLADMELGSSRITEIVKELRTHICTGEDAQKAPEEIEDVFRRVMTLTGKQLQKMVASYRYVIEPDLPAVVMNSRRVEQALINLVINAGHAAARPDSWIVMSAHRIPHDRDHVEIRVEDNGKGMPKHVLDQVFDPFFTTKGPDQGSGLGLWICLRIIEDHGGRISATSTEGEGTRFTIQLPIKASDTDRAGQREAEDELIPRSR